MIAFIDAPFEKDAVEVAKHLHNEGYTIFKPPQHITKCIEKPLEQVLIKKWFSIITKNYERRKEIVFVTASPWALTCVSCDHLEKNAIHVMITPHPEDATTCRERTRKTWSHYTDLQRKNIEVFIV